VTTTRRAPAPRVRALAALLLAGTTVAGCDSTTACPAIGWGRTLTVALADGWPPATGRTVLLECAAPCEVLKAEPGTPGPASAPLTGTSVVFAVTGGTTPESVTVTVADAAGTELARLETRPEWARVGGSEECGGPSEATVVVPAP
jgi:hypothetical protein